MNENKNRISWEELFIQMAILVSKKSADPKTQVGDVLVKENCVIGIGYNGAPRNFRYNFNWATSEKYDFVIHAEANAIANSQAIAGASILGDGSVTLIIDVAKLIDLGLKRENLLYAEAMTMAIRGN